jgi:hypothetical protein
MACPCRIGSLGVYCREAARVNQVRGLEPICDRDSWLPRLPLVGRIAAVRSGRSSRRPGSATASPHSSYDMRTRSRSFIRGCRSTPPGAGSGRSTSRRPRQPDDSDQTAAAAPWRNPPRRSHQRSARTRHQRRNDRHR